MRRFCLRLFTLLRPGRAEREMTREMVAHLALLQENFEHRGLPPDEAARAARRAYGGVELSKELYREARTFVWIGQLIKDVRYAARTLGRSPGFTTIAVLSLALGIGANTALFSLWNGVLRAPLPAVRQPGELVMLSNPDEVGSWFGRTDGDRNWITYGEFEQLRDSGIFAGLMASQTGLDLWQVRMSNGPWEEAHGRLVSGGFFPVLGVNPLVGRTFTAAADHSVAPYAVISYNYWQRRFGGRSDVLGKILTVRQAALTVIGVMPPDFIGESSAQRPDLWIPLAMQPLVIPGQDRLHDTPPQKKMWLHVFGRLKPGVTRAQAEAQANAVFQAGLESFYGPGPSQAMHRAYLNQHLRIRRGARGASQTRGEFSVSLTALLAGVGILLLIACANLTNLLLARGTARKPEIALRLSLGASRGRLLRQLVTESLTLAASGGVASLAVAYGLYGALVHLIAESDPDFRMSFELNSVVLGVAIVLTLAAALLVGLLPAWQVTKTGPAVSLQEQNRGGAGSLGRTGWGRWLVSLQLALSVPLLAGTGLLARTIYNLQHLDLGFSPNRLLVVRVDSTDAGYDPARRDVLILALRAEFQRIPGVHSVSYSQLGILSGGNSFGRVEVEGYSPPADADQTSSTDTVGPAYFSTLGNPLLHGREILESDRTGTPRVCVINEAFAHRFFKNGNPLGMRITSVGDKKRSTCQVVGVATDARTQRLRGAVRPRYFVAAAQAPSALHDPIFLIRSGASTAPVISAVRKIIQRLDPDLPIDTDQSVEDQMAPFLAQDRATAQIAVVFACVALSLAAVGLYGVLSYGVARRRGEIAIRIAVGAQPGSVIIMILGETFGLLATGLALGGAIGWAATRLIASRLYGISPGDPLTLTFATGLLLLVALAAAYLPARRASRLDPMIALRQR
jgi:predicted permease